jgi:hypothetical protein
MNTAFEAMNYLIDVVKNDQRFVDAFNKIYAIRSLTAAGVPSEHYESLLSDALNDFDVEIVNRLSREQNPALATLLRQMYPDRGQD